MTYRNLHGANELKFDSSFIYVSKGEKLQLTLLLNAKMTLLQFVVLIIILVADIVDVAVVPENDDIYEQGLYNKGDHIQILTIKNFDKKVYGQKHANLVQFYNSYCGHCRAFAPKFKSMATDIVPWKSIIQLAVLDCSVEENNEICRQFEVMAYPSLRYLHENYAKATTNVGDRMQATETAEKLKANLVTKMQLEQSMGRLPLAPSLRIMSFADYASAVRDVPSNVIYTFLVFEGENSTIGSQLALDTNDYQNILVKRIHDSSELAGVAGIRNSPGLVSVGPGLQTTLLTPEKPTKQNLLKSINSFLKGKNYAFPVRDIDTHDLNSLQISNDKGLTSDADMVYYSDLEKTLKTSLHTEITRHKILEGEPLNALLEYLDVLITSFPFRGNLRPFIVDLRNTLRSKSAWGGSEVYDLVKRLESTHAPVFATDLDYIGCRGSQSKYRGYSCGLWTMFHTLTVNAAHKSGDEGAKVLRAMHGYVKHFFGCSECSQHFQEMAARNRLFEVKENDKAVLWLWISHNEVNLRLSGDVTEDPVHPKIQYPSPSKCPECRKSRGAWNLPKVYQYLERVYGMENIQDARSSRSASTASSPFSNLDIGMLSLLYIFSFFILILVIKFFLSKRFYRKRRYKHEYGKV